MSRLAVAMVSGGLDSVTMAHYLKKVLNYDLFIVAFDYGQKHRRELECSVDCATDLDAEWHLVDLRSITPLMNSSSLTNDDLSIPEGHYTDLSMRSTVVPNRNAILLSIAYGIAIAQNAQVVAYSPHNGDAAIYPDCRPQFVDNIGSAFAMGTVGYAPMGLKIVTPFIDKTKGQIVRYGLDIGVDYSRTWSCYVGGVRACGKCGTCIERLEAFEYVGVKDPIEYM